MANTSPGGEPGRRRKQSIALGGLCLAIVIVLAFNYYRHWSKANPEIQSRTIYDFYITWRCIECGHELDDRGAQGTRPCPKCQTGEMYVCISHACPEHGAFPVYFLYDENSRHGDPSRIRVDDGEWVPYLDEDYNINVRCPRCGRELMPAELSRPAPKESPSP